MNTRVLFFLSVSLIGLSALASPAEAQDVPDFLRQMQLDAGSSGKATWGHWGAKKGSFSSWTNHSNRLVPIYVFGADLDGFKDSDSLYRDEGAIKKLYGRLPEQTHNSQANYLDQTDVYRIQKEAIAAGKKYVILMVFDGMDYQTTQAAAFYKSKKVTYDRGRGTGLSFLDYDKVKTDYGYFVSSAHNNGTDVDVDGQIVKNPGGEKRGGYVAELGGATPWSPVGSDIYLLGTKRDLPHVVTDSAASATSMTSGIKTYNSAINVDPDGKQVTPISHDLQKAGFAIGLVSSVPISHATPASGYAHNVTRNDYQDLSRDLLGLKSVAHKNEALSGVDVLIGGGWGEETKDDRKKQGRNYVPGNKYLSTPDIEKIDSKNGGRYIVAQRTKDQAGSKVLAKAAQQAVDQNKRLFGFFGGQGGHLPYQTADGDYKPTRSGTEKPSIELYTKEDVTENPTLAEMTQAALAVLESKSEKGFWLMIEPGDVDWANHSNNIDNSIGAVLSGEAAFDVVTQWVEKNDAWDETVLIVTADHGHYFVLDQPEALTGPGKVITADAEQKAGEDE